MKTPVDTCPECGALVTPQLTRCRQCKQYLHGTQIEGFLFEHLLPDRLAAAPGTGVFFLAIILYYILTTVLGGFRQAAGFTPYTLIQLGSLFGPAIREGEYWRFCTSMLAHGDLVHLAFNLYALTIVGPLIEELFDRKRMMLIFLLSGLLSMATSYVYYEEILGRLVNSVGASGAVSGLVGACLIGARRRGPEGRQVAQVMLRWTVYMAVFGFLVNRIDNAAHVGIDNAAHVGGWLVGAGLAAVIPPGIVKEHRTHMALSIGILGLLATLLVSVGMMLASARGVPLSFERSGYPGRLLFFTYRTPVDPRLSDELMAFQDCEDAVAARYAPDARRNPDADAKAVLQCRIASRAYPASRSFQLLANAYEKAGDPERASTAMRTAARLAQR